MNTTRIADIIARIERAPNVARLVRLVDTALGGGAITIHRKGSLWEVQEDEVALYQCDFATLRLRLASYVAEAHSYDEDEPCADLVCASAEDAHIILSGMEAERSGGDRLAAEIAAAATGWDGSETEAATEQVCDLRAGNYDPRAAAGARLPIWSGGWSDEELLAVVRPIVEQISDELALSLVEGEIAAAGEKAVAATKAWMSLCEHKASGEVIDYVVMWEARVRMQDWHRFYSDIQDIQAIGEVGDPLTLHSVQDGIGVYRDGEDEPMLTLPRGIAPDMAKLVVLTHRRAYLSGKDAGVEQAQNQMRRALGLYA